MKPIFFADSGKLRTWLSKNHGSASEAWVGLYKKGSGRPSITWPERMAAEPQLEPGEEEALLEGCEREIRGNEGAWAFFQTQPPSYRKASLGWVVAARREETRRRRLETLIRDAEEGLRIAPLRR